MSTISSVSTNGYGYNAPASSAVSAALAQSAATQLSVTNTLASLGSNSSAPLTYNAAGLLSAFQQTVSNTSNNTTTKEQSAQNAFLQVEYAISQTMNSLISGSSSNANTSDISSLFNLSGTSDTNGIFGSPTGSLLSSSTGSTSAQAAQYAVINAQYAVTQALGTLTSSPSSSNK